MMLKPKINLDRFRHESGMLRKLLNIAVLLALEEQQRARLRGLKRAARSPIREMAQ